MTSKGQVHINTILNELGRMQKCIDRLNQQAQDTDTNAFGTGGAFLRGREAGLYDAASTMQSILDETTERLNAHAEE